VAYSIRARKVAQELALARQAERQARIRQAEQAAAEFDAEYLTPAAAARMTGFSVATLRRLNAEGRGPRPLKLGTCRQSRLRYPRDEVVAWISDRMAYETASRQADRTKFTPPPAARSQS